MERLFYQRKWQNVSFSELTGISTCKVAEREFYSSFYEFLLSHDVHPSARWLNQKYKVGEWLATEYFGERGREQKIHAFSVGTGIGMVEEWLWEHGYDVDVLECEPYSLSILKKRFPKIRGVVGDARCIPCRGGTYDLVYMTAVDYCFDREQYKQVLKEMKRLVKPQGRVLCVCVSNLSLKAVLTEAVKRPLKHCARLDRSGFVPWGYKRTVGEHIVAGETAGLVCEGVYLFDDDFILQAIRKPDSASLRWSTIRDYIVAVAFKSP